MSATRIAQEYGVQEFNGLEDPNAYWAMRQENGGPEYMSLAELAQRRGRVTRVRLLTSERLDQMGTRIYDFSYIHAVLPDGTQVSLRDVPLGVQGNKRTVMGELIHWAKREKVFAKGLGLLDQGNWSILLG